MHASVAKTNTAWTKNLAPVRNARTDADPAATMSMNAMCATEDMAILTMESAKNAPRMPATVQKTRFSVDQDTLKIIRRIRVSDAKINSVKAVQTVHPNAWYVEKRRPVTR
jgi:hypothetical protein